MVQIDSLGYYQALGVAPGKATESDEIKSAFRKLAQVMKGIAMAQYVSFVLQRRKLSSRVQTMHPDKLPADASDDKRAAATEAFRVVQEAYDVLRDPEARARYDEGKLTAEASRSK